MPEIRLSNSNDFALVDEQDFDLVNSRAWHRDLRGYARAGIGNETVHMHILIMNPPDGFTVDHRDRNPLNNTRANLRIATRSQQQGNSKKPKHGSPYASRFRGVRLDRRSGRWAAAISKMGAFISLGAYASEEDAARAYNRAAYDYWGEFALLNDVSGWENFEIKVQPQRQKRSGVCWHKKAGKWVASVVRKGKYHYIGIFECRQQAIDAREQFIQKHFPVQS